MLIALVTVLPLPGPSAAREVEDYNASARSRRHREGRPGIPSLQTLRMMELDGSETESVGGGLFVLFSAFKAASDVVYGVYRGIHAAGATLSNYYGRETTLELFHGGNLAA